MNLNENAQLLYNHNEPELFQCNNWVMKSDKGIHARKRLNKYVELDQQYKKSPTDDTANKKSKISKEIRQVKEDIIRFKSDMNGLAKEIDGIGLDLNISEDRVHEIEERLIATQEINVNLQILLEKVVHKQQESDIYATRVMRHIHTNLAIVVSETGKLKGRLSTVAKSQQQHQGNVNDIVKRIKEYTHMLEQAHGEIQSFNHKRKEDVKLYNHHMQHKHHHPLYKPHHHHVHHHHLSNTSVSNTGSHSALSTTNNSNTNSTNSISQVNKLDLYRHRIIRKRSTELNSSPWLAQKGLKILLTDN